MGSWAKVGAVPSRAGSCRRRFALTDQASFAKPSHVNPASLGQSNWATTPDVLEGGDKRVGLIGVGLLGAALAERLIAGGRRVLGFDTDPARLDALKGKR